MRRSYVVYHCPKVKVQNHKSSYLTLLHQHQPPWNLRAPESSAGRSQQEQHPCWNPPGSPDQMALIMPKGSLTSNLLSSWFRLRSLPFWAPLDQNKSKQLIRAALDQQMSQPPFLVPSIHGDPFHPLVLVIPFNGVAVAGSHGIAVPWLIAGLKNPHFVLHAAA